MADKSICDLMEEFRPIIESLIDRSLQKNREYGFLVCREDDDLSIAGVCEGTKCRINNIEGCEGKDVGMFHTHPSAYTPAMSGRDVTYAVYHNHDFSCIGTRGSVKCWFFDKSNPQYQEIRRIQDRIDEDRRDFNKTIARYNKDLEAWEAGGVEVERRILLAKSAENKRWRRRYKNNKSRLNIKAREECPLFTEECLMFRIR